MSKSKVKENKKLKKMTKEELLASLENLHNNIIKLREKREKNNGTKI